MSKILKKISASLILILMIFSVAFNVLDYGYKVYAEGSNISSVSISATGNVSKKLNSIDASQDTTVKVDVTVNASEKPQSVVIKIENKEKESSIRQYGPNSFSCSETFSIDGDIKNYKNITVQVKDAQGQQSQHSTSIEVIEKKELDPSQVGKCDLILTKKDNIQWAKQKFGNGPKYGEMSERFHFDTDASIEFWETTFNPTDSSRKNNQIFCTGQGNHIDFKWEKEDNYVVNMYTESDYSVSEEYQYALIYLNEGKWGNDNMKYYAIQAYIWTTSLNKGNILDLDRQVEASYRDKIQDAMDAAKDAMNNNGILTLKDGKKVKIKKFSAKWYTWKEAWTKDGRKLTYGSDHPMQPFMTFDYELEDGGTGFQLKKVDETGEKGLTATFDIFVKKDGNWEPYVTEENTTGKYTTDENKFGESDIIPLEEGEYLIIESEAPSNYTPTSQYAIVKVDKDGEIEYEIHNVQKEDLTEDGYVTKDKIQNSTIVNGEEADWGPGEVEAGGPVQFQLMIKNKDIPILQLKKVDETGVKGLTATFDVFVEKDGNWEPYVTEENTTGQYTTDENKDGEIDIPVEEGKYLIIESKAPSNYTPTSQYAIVTVDEDGHMDYEIHTVPEEDLTEDGYVTKDKIQNSTIVDGEEYDWEPGEVEPDGPVKLQLIVKNKHKPTIKITKVDENGEVITGKGGTLHVKITSEDGSTIYDKDVDLNDGPTELTYKDLEKMEGNIYTVTIQEIEPPEGYDKPEKDTFEFQVIFTEEGGWSIAPNNNDPKFFEATINGNIIEAKIKNIKKKDLELKVVKTGGDGEGLNDVQFQLDIGALGSFNLTGNQEGETIDKEDLKPGTYTATLTEENPPEGYKPLEPTTFEITIDEAGAITVGNSSNRLVTLSTQASEEKVTVTITVINIKEDEETTGTGIPLLMNISGKVWLDQPQGKNSQANGQYDSGDKLLKDIEVELYESDGVTPAKFADKDKVKEELNNKTAQTYLTPDQIDEIKTIAESIPDTHITTTNEAGEFYFEGLDPAKTYTIIFRYNGMRYQEIMASIGVEGSGISSGITTTAKAVEDATQRQALTQKYQDIDPGDIVFTQTEVENFLQSGKVPDGFSADQIKQFIQDTKIEARIDGIGNILSDCESKLQKWNGGLGLELGIQSGYVFPVVVEKSVYKESYSEQKHNDPTGYKKAQDYIDANFTPYYLNNSNLVGYRIIETEVYFQRKVTIYYPGNHTGKFQCTHPKEYTYYEPKTHSSYWVDYIMKGYENYGDLSGLDPSNTWPCQSHDEETRYRPTWGYVDDEGHWGITGSEQYTYRWKCGQKVGTEYEYRDEWINQGESTWEIMFYYVQDGYHSEVEENKEHCTRLAVFDTEHEPLFDTDSKSSRTSQCPKNSEWGWENILTGINDNKLEELDPTLDCYEGLGKSYQYLWKQVRANSPKEEDLCVVYRPTVDLGLYKDVQKAIVTINGQTEKYIYDKRAANGKIFQFGVNEFDIQSGRNVKGNVEEAYAEYYQSLSNGTPNPGKSTVTVDDYDPIGIRKEDININMVGTGSMSNSSSATAGYYNDYDVNIEMVYRIKIFNESNVSARVTNIMDYHMSSFHIDGIYADADCNTPLTNIGIQNATVDNLPTGFEAKNIPLGSITLSGNSSYEIFIKLTMNDPKGTLGGDVLDEGYDTWNYAEINGYGTNIGVIDIDSSPGDLIKEGRFAGGPFDDDEGRSPTLTYKNPENASRTISGVMFEDETGKTEIRTYPGERRDGNGVYDGSDKPVAGAKVTLIEVTESGQPLDSPNDPDTGVRAQVLTDANGTFQFNKVVASNYIVRYEYGNNYETVLTSKSRLDGHNLLNGKSYNGESFENTVKDTSLSGVYWYASTNANSSYALDNANRRIAVTNEFTTIQNERAQILNSYKDVNPNLSLVDELIRRANMYAETDRMLLDVEYNPRYPGQVVETQGNGSYEKKYVIGNINFGIVERERAELQITKKVSYVSLVDSSGKPITGGTEADLIAGNIDYIKMVPNTEENGIITSQGFVGMEIDKELLTGATLRITYEITIANTSEYDNEIRNIQIVDYVSNNLNYDENSGQGWTPITTDYLTNNRYVNNTSINTDDVTNKIDLSTSQTILMTKIDSLVANGMPVTKTLTLEKNLSSEEDSNFNYENQVEIVESTNSKGRGDYSSIYGNLDPFTYTSKQGDLNWDEITSRNENGYPQEKTTYADDVYAPSIREAEKDSGNAEEVSITPPTGAKGIVLQTYHYILALVALTTLAASAILIKKYIAIPKE